MSDRIVIARNVREALILAAEMIETEIQSIQARVDGLRDIAAGLRDVADGKQPDKEDP